jgi:mannosyltransferase
MIETNKTYGFTIAVKELKETVPNIFRYASAYKRVNNLTSKGLWEMFIEPQPDAPVSLPEDDPNYKHPLPEEILRGDPSHASIPEIDPEAMEGEKYNMCHFWSNFEIARLGFFRSKEYEDFFQMMDRSGGFWMERVSFRGPGCPALHLLTGIVGRRTNSFSRCWSTSCPT